jgi:hypothetical protein
MKKAILSMLIIVLMVVMSPSCKKSFVWDPTGSWTWTVIVTGFDDLTEMIVLSGSESGGSLTGWEGYNPLSTPGTWSKTGDFTITVNIDFYNFGWHNVVNLTFTSSEAAPNSMNGTGTWTEYYGSTLNDVYNINVSAIKTSNPQ